MTLLLRRPMVMALAALLLLLIAAIACGPVAPEDLHTPPAIQQPAPLSDSGAASETPASTETPTPLPPKPTPLPTLPPKPTETPPPTPLPAADWRTPAPALPPDTPHPEGLAGCLESNIFSDTIADEAYLVWCANRIEGHIIAVCRGLGGPAAELRCAARELATARDYATREGFIQCVAITDDVAMLDCSLAAIERIDKQTLALWEVWPKVQAVVERAPEVAAAQRELLRCLAASGYANIDAELLFSWQDFRPPAAAINQESGLTAEQKSRQAALAEPTHQCAQRTGFYAAQHAAWLAEVERLAAADPEAAQPLLNEGLLEMLRESETAPFLTLR